MATHLSSGQLQLQLLALPLSHIFARVCLYACLGTGMETAIATSVPAMLEEAREIRPTIIAGVPHIFERVHRGLFDAAARRARGTCGRDAGRGAGRARGIRARPPPVSHWNTAEGSSRLSEPSTVIPVAPSFSAMRSITRVWAISPFTAPITSASPFASPAFSIMS